MSEFTLILALVGFVAIPSRRMLLVILDGRWHSRVTEPHSLVVLRGLAVSNPVCGVCVYKKGVLGSWTQLGPALHGDQPGDCFGCSVSARFPHNDGEIVAVGACRALKTRGCIRVFQLSYSRSLGMGNIFKQTPKWMPVGRRLEGLQEGDSFGTSLSLSTDGKKLAVGALQWTIHAPGYVQVYSFENGHWKQDGSILRGTGARGHFGAAISLSDNGRWLAVGSYAHCSQGLVKNGVVKVLKKKREAKTGLSTKVTFQEKPMTNGSVLLSLCPCTNGNAP